MWPSTVVELIESWKFGYITMKGCILWNCRLVAILWSIWLERNYRVFNNRKQSPIAVVINARSKVISWVLGARL